MRILTLCMILVGSLASISSTTLAKVVFPTVPTEAPRTAPSPSAARSRQAVGGAIESASPVWFSVEHGTPGEVFYPTPTQRQLGDILFVVTDEAGNLSIEGRDTYYQVTTADEGLSIRIAGEDRQRKYLFTQDLIADTASPAYRIRTHFTFLQSGLRVFAVIRSGMNVEDVGEVEGDELLITGTSAVSARSIPAFANGAVGYGKLAEMALDANPLQTVLTAEVPHAETDPELDWDVVVGFGNDRAEASTYSQTALGVEWTSAYEAFTAGWKNYLAALRKPSFVFESPFAQRSVQILKLLEGKGVDRGHFYSEFGADPEMRGSYLAAVALLAAGDRNSPSDALEYWTQDAGIDYLAPNEAALPILLAAKLHAGGAPAAANAALLRRCANRIATAGPEGRDLWGQLTGNIPSALAAEVAGLRAYAELAVDADLGAVAMDWQTQIERWTLFDDRGIYSRGNGLPFEGEEIDGGFLDLVRWGVRSAEDPRIAKTLSYYDNPEMGFCALGAGNTGNYYRAPIDENGYRPELSAERGQFAVAARDLQRANAELAAVERAGNSNGLIPQRLDARFQIAADSPMPWGPAHAEDLLLHRAIADNSPFEFQAP